MRMKDDLAGARRALDGLHNAALDVVGAGTEAEADPEQRLITALIEADAWHEATIGRSDAAAIERYGWWLFLRASIDLINSNPDLYEHKLAAAPARMLAALEDLDRGRTHPALRAVKRSKHATGPRSRVQSTAHGHLAGIVEGLMRYAEMSEPEAANWLQRRLSARNIRMTPDQLIAWRKQARGARKDDFMRIAFHKVQVEDWKADPIYRAGRLLDNVLKMT